MISQVASPQWRAAGIGITHDIQNDFDAEQSGYTTWWFPAYGLIFVCVGALFVWWSALYLVGRHRFNRVS